MTRSSRMPGALTGSGGSAPVVDELSRPAPAVVAPAPAQPEPDDALAALLAPPSGPGVDQGDNPLLTDAERADLRELARAKSLRGDYQTMEKALGRRASELQGDLLGILDDPDRELDWGRPFTPFVEGDQEIRPYLQRPYYPKYREAADDGTQYAMADLIEAIRETEDPELLALIQVSLTRAWSSWAGKRVKAWQASRPDADTGRVIDGKFVDHDGVPLAADEIGDPGDDSLALPAPLRRIVEMVATPDIRFTRVPLVSTAVAAVDAATEVAEAAAGAADGESAGD